MRDDAQRRLAQSIARAVFERQGIKEGDLVLDAVANLATGRSALLEAALIAAYVAGAKA